VTNAVRHAPPRPDGTILLKLEVETATIRVSVHDGGAAIELERSSFDDETLHLGLPLVDRLADRWGSDDGESAVWFEVDLSR
jgi:anti-sigma regulatory factor (Ser/Thr protein kinase)